jgi:hypothetical protein
MDEHSVGGLALSPDSGDELLVEIIVPRETIPAYVVTSLLEIKSMTRTRWMSKQYGDAPFIESINRLVQTGACEASKARRLRKDSSEALQIMLEFIPHK